jgi:hypothetical protein
MYQAILSLLRFLGNRWNYYFIKANGNLPIFVTQNADFCSVLSKVVTLYFLTIRNHMNEF